MLHALRSTFCASVCVCVCECACACTCVCVPVSSDWFIKLSQKYVKSTTENNEQA